MDRQGLFCLGTPVCWDDATDSGNNSSVYLRTIFYFLEKSTCASYYAHPLSICVQMAGMGVSWSLLSDCAGLRERPEIWWCWPEIPAGQLESGWGFADVKHPCTHAGWVKEQRQLDLEQNLPLLLNHTPINTNLGVWEYGFLFVKKRQLFLIRLFQL